MRRRGADRRRRDYDLTQAGRTRAADALARNLYSGPAPVPLGAYIAQVQRAERGRHGRDQSELQQALRGVVIRPEMRDQLGAAMNSDRAIMLYGPPGSGKTYLCEQMPRLLSGDVAVPHAIRWAAKSSACSIPLVHRPCAKHDGPHLALDNRHRTDRALGAVRASLVISGGELTLEMLDLVFDPRAGYYQAPPHFKANNGLFLVDDLGRQMVTPRQLMNRWIVPMERRHDYLMLRNGSKFRIPFDMMLVFSTNLTPAEVADDAFLRRIGYKIFVGELPLDEYRQILREVCEQRDVAYSDEAFDLFVQQLPRALCSGRCWPATRATW